MPVGGKRPGAGRKKGYRLPKTLEKMAAQEYVRTRVFAALDPLITAQLRAALRGNQPAAKDLLDRALGPATQNVTVSGPDGQPMVFTWLAPPRS